MSLVMTQAECEAFLAELHVAIISVADEGRGPLTVPIWYNYEPGGEIKLWTGGDARKVKRPNEALLLSRISAGAALWLAGGKVRAGGNSGRP